MSNQEEVWVVAAALDELAERSVTGIEIAGHEIALYRLSDGEVFATSDICTHGHAYLSEGWVTEEDCIECPLHAGCFDIRTGAGVSPPIDEDVRTYPIRIEDGQVLVRIS